MLNYCLFIVASMLLPAEPKNDLVVLRTLYYEAALSEKKCETFCNYLESNPKVKPSILKAYSALGLMMKAKYSWNPYDKLNLFSKGKNLLNESIQFDQTNLELRFLRYAAQKEAPAFLGYNDHLTEDKNLIVKGYEMLEDEDLKIRIKRYLFKN